MALETYKDFRPTTSDQSGLSLVERHGWLVAAVRDRDSDALARANYRAIHNALTAAGPSDDFEDHRFGHWACGWLELLIVRPGSPAHKVAEEIAEGLENYPVVDSDLFQAEEDAEAERVWRACYNVRERLDFIRRYRSDFDFRDMRDLLGCVRGAYFAGLAGTLLSR